MGTLAAALSWADRGFQVFPLHENSKEPAHTEWVSQATTDKDIIRAIWTDPVLKTEKNYNIGCLCTDMVVVDIDVKEGKDGHNEYAQLGGQYDTLVVQTPTGGFHCYFYGPDSSNSPISKSVDIRSHNGFVVAPGSSINGVPYSLLYDNEMKWVPANIERLLTPAYARDDTIIADFEVDTDANVAAAIRFLESAPVAVEGQRGDETTFVTAARLVREMGVSVNVAFCLMRDHWNERCMPPWDLHDLLRKVENAASYGTAEAGKLTSEATFGQVAELIVPPPTVFVQNDISFGNALLPTKIPPRPWLVERMLMRQNITLLLAAGSAGKSSISLSLAMHLGLGLEFAGNKPLTKCKTIIYNGEDDLHEQSRRLMAMAMAHSLDYKEVSENVMLLSPEQVKLTLVNRAERSGLPVTNDVIVNQLIEIASAPDVGLIVVDPLVKLHTCNESDNVEMDVVMETLTKIARQANVSVLVLHHSSKATSRQEDRIGNMDIGRGASAIVNASRIAFTLMGPSHEDAEMYGFNEEDMGRWVRMDDAKMNLSLAGEKATWFRKEGVKIPSGDIVGVLHHEEVTKTHEHIQSRIAKILIGTMEANNKGSMSIKEAVNIVKSEEPLWANKKDIAIRQRLEGLFHIAYEIDGRVVKVDRTEADKPLIVLT